MSTYDKLDTINDSLNDIKTAIIAKGQTPTGNITTYATAINNIPQQSVITSLNVTPTTSSQIIAAPSGTDGYSPVNVAAVTSSIDSNITAGNIKSGVSILGVTGTYEGDFTEIETELHNLNSGTSGGSQKSLSLYISKSDASGSNMYNIVQPVAIGVNVDNTTEYSTVPVPTTSTSLGTFNTNSSVVFHADFDDSADVDSYGCPRLYLNGNLVATAESGTITGGNLGSILDYTFTLTEDTVLKITSDDNYDIAPPEIIEPDEPELI